MDKGYDPADVPSRLCLMCKLPIGTRAWRVVTTLARFGQMLFEHEVCPTPGNTTVFQCPDAKCAYAIDSADLNKVQLQVLRRTAKRCPGCGNLQRFMEQTSLPNIQTKISKSYGGTKYEKNSQKTSGSIPKSESQRRRAARYTGA